MNEIRKIVEEWAKLKPNIRKVVEDWVKLNPGRLNGNEQKRTEAERSY